MSTIAATLIVMCFISGILIPVMPFVSWQFVMYHAILLCLVTFAIVIPIPVKFKVTGGDARYIYVLVWVTSIFKLLRTSKKQANIKPLVSVLARTN